MIDTPKESSKKIVAVAALACAVLPAAWLVIGEHSRRQVSHLLAERELEYGKAYQRSGSHTPAIEVCEKEYGDCDDKISKKVEPQVAAVQKLGSFCDNHVPVDACHLIVADLIAPTVAPQVHEIQSCVEDSIRCLKAIK